jgi:DnaJ family protein C protein 28
MSSSRLRQRDARRCVRHIPRRNQCSQTGSAKLLADAVREEIEQENSSQKPPAVLASEHPNWTGEESMHDVVLRMLVDKYKPLRGGTIRTADEKLKDASQRPTMAQSLVTPAKVPSIEDHKPWHTTFKPPSLESPSIRYGQTLPAHSHAVDVPSWNERVQRRESAAKKKLDAAGRLMRAKESTFDYRLGIKSSPVQRGRPNPTSLKGWASMIEEKIEVGMYHVRSHDSQRKGTESACRWLF